MADENSQAIINAIRCLGKELCRAPAEYFGKADEKTKIAAVKTLVLCLLQNEADIASNIITVHGKQLMRSGMRIAGFLETLPAANHPFMETLRKMGANHVHALDALAWNSLSASKLTTETLKAMERTHVFSMRKGSDRITSFRENIFVRQARRIARHRGNIAFLAQIGAFEKHISAPPIASPSRTTGQIVRFPERGPGDGYILR